MKRMILIILMSFTLVDCFDIFQYVEIKPDNSATIFYEVGIVNMAFADWEKYQSDEIKKKSRLEKIEKFFHKFFEGSYKGVLESPINKHLFQNFRYQILDQKYQVKLYLSYRIKNLKLLNNKNSKGQKDFGVFPVFLLKNDKRPFNQMIFRFRRIDKIKTKFKDSSQSEEELKERERNRMVFSSATYHLLFKGREVIVAKLYEYESPGHFSLMLTIKPIKIKKNVYYLAFPMSYIIEDNEYKLVVTYL